MKDTYSYEALIDALEELVPSANNVGLGAVRAIKTRLELYSLSVLGNALAQQRAWSVRGLEAIDFALMTKYSWHPDHLRTLEPASKWLALHQDLLSLEFPRAAVAAWHARYEGIGVVDLLAWTSNPLGLPPTHTTGPQQG
ncbi:hypothetical protein [Pseudomonas amygdali]|uniref:hypothetical protein n=1 Tax=Pseudomonas amygdali TaxID=47877 RepID=UPI0013659A34|nr:hypothetical protein [Pseudomonas amygdali]WGQ01751.1 hypothetical protein QFG70_05130 [Pseudomonas amygdali pv. aesculi]